MQYQGYLRQLPYTIVVQRSPVVIMTSLAHLSTSESPCRVTSRIHFAASLRMNDFPGLLNFPIMSLHNSRFTMSNLYFSQCNAHCRFFFCIIKLLHGYKSFVALGEKTFKSVLIIFVRIFCSSATLCPLKLSIKRTLVRPSSKFLMAILLVRYCGMALQLWRSVL